MIPIRSFRAACGLILLLSYLCVCPPSNLSAAPSVGRTSLSLRGDPQFSTSHLHASARLWYGRFWAALRNTDQYQNVNKLALSNDTYEYGRPLNTFLTSVLQVFRVTGDLRLLDEVDRVSQIMRGQLRDRSIIKKGSKNYKADGYLNWLYDYDADYRGTDLHEMDEMLSHSLIAAVAYAFYVNQDLDPRYAERARFWTDYLQNEFEAKWRVRKKIPTGFPFLEKHLTHAYLQWIRYHYYMFRLTGEKGYENEALRMAKVIGKHIMTVPTPLGPAAQWDHGMPELGTKALGAQPTNYARYTVQAAADLACEGFSIFGRPGYMESMARMLASLVMDPGAPESFAGDVTGKGKKREKYDRYAISPWTMLGRWDASGNILNVSEQVYRKVESSLDNPRHIYIPAGVIFAISANERPPLP